MTRNLLRHNLKPSLHKQVLNSILTTFEEVIRNTLFLEDTAVGVTPEKNQGLGAATQQQESTHTALLLGQCFSTKVAKCSLSTWHNMPSVLIRRPSVGASLRAFVASFVTKKTLKVDIKSHTERTDSLSTLGAGSCKHATPKLPAVSTSAASVFAIWSKTAAGRGSAAESMAPVSGSWTAHARLSIEPCPGARHSQSCHGADRELRRWRSTTTVVG